MSNQETECAVPSPLEAQFEDAVDPTWRELMGNVRQAARQDYETSESRVKTLASGLGILATQTMGKANIPGILTPMVAVGVLQSTGSPFAVGAASAAVYGAFAGAGTGLLNVGTNHYPQTVSAIARNFPSVARTVNRLLPGVEQSSEKPRTSLISRFGKAAVAHIRRGVMAYSAGGAYMIAAALDGQSKPAKRRLAARISLDGALVVGIASTGVAEALVGLGKSHPQVAEQIQNGVRNPLLWYGVAAALMVREWHRNRPQLSEVEKPAPLELTPQLLEPQPLEP